jgi:uncharacterized protein (TIGR00730 family)
MNEPPSETRTALPERTAREEAIRDFVARFAPSEDSNLLEEMMVTICRLARDGCGRGELKILNAALKELRYAFKTFAPYSEIRKVSIFGSSRTLEHQAEYQQAVNFAARMREHNWMVITGAGDGIMRAGHGGAGREKSFGVAIRLPFEQATNEIIADDSKLINFRYFFTRKLVFIKEASAVALFPGGFGTQDEGFEAVTLVQTGKAGPLPVVLVDAKGGTYWQHWREYVRRELLGGAMIDPEDLNLLTITDDAEEAAQVILRFYRRYHSSRFVGDEFVIRMISPLDAAAIDRLNAEFSDTLREGRIRALDGPLPAENGAYPELPRLALAFNRRRFARLRMLVDAINDA